MVALGEDLKKKMSRHGDGDQTLCRVSRHHSAKALPSVRFLALGKEIFADKFFAECHTRQSLCRVGLSLCRVCSTLGKEGASCSE